MAQPSSSGDKMPSSHPAAPATTSVSYTHLDVYKRQLLVGVLIALTALIPIVGAFIGCAVGALLMLVNDPWQALWFIVLFLVLQQIEGNLIYPHVVGSSVGLPSIWVLAAVTVGGSLMGILGMLVFIPLCSVLYALLRQLTVHRLKQRRVPAEKWREPPKK